ncbi:DUF72 domain-containing protein [Flavobacterium sp. W21_SRS_FM6]|uniref:DUF72 domain-containing protein n=1 Tax=Flavobacterium sp. W21_SRS_FM6 TaxID=3240268 RepID=UPI003F8F4A0C
MNHCYIGCPIWTHPSWFGHIYPTKSAQANSLVAYSQYFNSVEGNSSFYHLPDVVTLARWAKSVPQNFKFTLKFPSTISHQGNLSQSHKLVEQALIHFSVLKDKLGSLMLQLPASFNPASLDALASFLAVIPTQFKIAVEVRHPDFFAKGDSERHLNQLLQGFNADRIIMDTRALFACNTHALNAKQASLIREVQEKKPRLPTHVVATGQRPIVRFVGGVDIEQSKPFYQPWLHKLKQWLDEGKSPSLFFHMPDNQDAPWLAEAFIHDFNRLFPQQPLKRFSLPPRFRQQQGMFD